MARRDHWRSIDGLQADRRIRAGLHKKHSELWYCGSMQGVQRGRKSWILERRHLFVEGFSLICLNHVVVFMLVILFSCFCLVHMSIWWDEPHHLSLRQRVFCKNVTNQPANQIQVHLQVQVHRLADLCSLVKSILTRTRKLSHHFNNRTDIKVSAKFSDPLAHSLPSSPHFPADTIALPRSCAEPKRGREKQPEPRTAAGLCLSKF